MQHIKITGVPEHFNYPITQAVSQNLSISTQWHYTPEGTGAMIQQLESGETDVALLLTEGFVKANQLLPSTLYFGGFYISTPLVWGVHAGAAWNASQYPNNPPQKVLISRKNSGSHLMFGLLQDQHGWKHKPQFEIINNLRGAIAAAQEDPSFLFLWEKYTTQPYCEQGIFKRVADLPSPWPAFSIAVHQRVVDAFGKSAVQQWIKDLTRTTKSIVSQPGLVGDIANYSALPEARIAAWREQTTWLGIAPDAHLKTLEAAQEKMVHLRMVASEATFQLL